MAYSKKVLKHFENPQNVGSMDEDDQDVGTGLVGAPACGDAMKMQIRVGKGGKIEKAVFKTFGCGSAIASSSWTTAWLHGKTLDEAEGLKNTVIAKDLALPPVKLHCSLLAEDGVRAAIADYRRKQEDQVQGA